MSETKTTQQKTADRLATITSAICDCLTTPSSGMPESVADVLVSEFLGAAWDYSAARTEEGKSNDQD
jgi:hypothetical protein